ncbi:hypothetical protein [Aquabacterium sp.]|uniref:hypothetical protein n=1 Tax=Aquabacterium sp. TaxID=1872578 RepID=UPI00198C704B|nr:hypothetical protein [Aquabacterium sp.]MBC7700863.1 hypothetical protein [Aquabacterium sp.]
MKLLRWIYQNNRVTVTISTLVAMIFLYAFFVYVIPTLSGQSIVGSYDAFTYAFNMEEDREMARELQPFLGAYPGGLSKSVLPIYAMVLHLALMALPLQLIRKSEGRNTLLALLGALMIPESAIFLGAVSKEGLAIVAVVAALAGQAAFFDGRTKSAFLLSVYAIALAQYSRPGFGFPFGVAVLAAYFPCLRMKTRYQIVVTAVVALFFVVWSILAGPFEERFTEAYQIAQTFLVWFEENMGSESPIKSAVRYFFSLAFGSDSPTLLTLALIAVMAVLKAVVYFFAIPLVSLADFTDMPAQTWALTWQFACSMSTFVMVVGVYRVYRSKLELTLRDKSRLWFGFSLIFLISISTAIFHVRYRAPAVVVVVFALWAIRSPSWVLFFMTVPALGASFWAILTTLSDLYLN